MRFSAAMNFPLPLFHMAAQDKPRQPSAQPSAPRAPIAEPPPQRRMTDEDDFDLARRVRESGEW